MELFSGIGGALAEFGRWPFLLAFLLGCLNGMVFGLLPGLSGSVGIALMIPFTYGMGPTESMALFVAALSGQTFAGSISAILLNTPGTSPNAATTFDGYPLARQGRGGFALGISATASALGSLVGVAVLVLMFPLMRSVILSFSFPEVAMLGVVGLAAIALASRGSLLKGLIAGALGLMLSFVGFAPIGGDLRYVFGRPELYDGIGVVAVLIGLFAISEAMRLLLREERVAADVSNLKFGHGQVFEGVVYTLKRPFLVLRSSLLGTAIGVVPAVGGTVAAFLAYFQAAKTVKDPRFGEGDPRGVLAPEASNDGKDAGAALPTLAFGLPGSADWAIILGAMVIHGIQPGPNLIRDSPEIVWVAVVVILAASWVSSSVGLLAAPLLVQVTRFRVSLLAPVVAVLAIVGAFGLEQRTSDVLIAVGIGVLAYFMRVAAFPVVPMILGLILGTTVERAYLQTISSFGSPLAFVTRPISLALLIIAIILVALEIRSNFRQVQVSEAEREEYLRTAISPLSLGLVAGFGAVAAVALVIAQGFSDDARPFPSGVALAVLALSGLYLAVALVPGLRTRFAGIIADSGGMERMAGGGAARQRAVERESLGIGVPGPPDAAVPPDGEPSLRPVAGTDTSTGTSTEASAEPSTGSSTTVADRPSTVVLVVVLLGGALATLFVGLAVVVPVLLIVLFRVVGRERWTTTLVTSAATCAFLYLVFVQVLNLSLQGGVLLPY